ncbi:MAG: hypothetical protein KBT21_03935 [Treponema sp.]|nr:hypothetical protein [Candidatus Treponema merdequi]
MWNLLKKFFLFSFIILLAFTSCGKNKKLKQSAEYKPVTNFLTQGTSTYESDNQYKEIEEIPEFKKIKPQFSYDKNIDDIYFTEIRYAHPEMAGSYIKTKPGTSVKMYSHADYTSDEYYIGDFSEGELAVILYADCFTETPGACPSYLKIMKLDEPYQIGYVKYDSEFNNNFLCTADYYDDEYKENVIHNINARAVFKSRNFKPVSFSYNMCASNDNSKFALLCKDKIYIYNSEDTENPVILEAEKSGFKCNDDSLIVFSKKNDLIYLVNKKSELYEINIDSEKAELRWTFIDNNDTENLNPEYLRIDPEGRYLYFSALNKIDSDVLQYIYAYDTWDKTSDACEQIVECKLKNHKNTLSDFNFGTASKALCTYDDNGKMVLQTYPHHGGLSETEEFDYNQFKIDEQLDIDDVFYLKDSDDFTYVKSNPYCFKYADERGDFYEGSDSFIYNFDYFDGNVPSKVEFLYNQNGDSSYLSAYDAKNKSIYIYSGDTRNYLFSFSTENYQSNDREKIYWNGNTFYVFNDFDKSIEIYKVDLIERNSQLDFSYEYDSDIKKMCERPCLFYNEDPDTELWVSFSPQGMYALFAVDNMSGEVRGVLRGEYEFTGETSAKLFKARNCYELYEYREQYEKMFMNLPVLNEDESFNTTEIYINFNNEDVRGYCSWLEK